MTGTLIEFTDSAGVHWHVWEVGQRLAHATAGAVTGEYPPVQHSGWLCFESAAERRRLTYYPYKWFKLSVARLEQLCEMAVPSGMRIRAPETRADPR